MAKIRLLIERFGEYRTALITRTVTGGLPPEAARLAGVDPCPRLKPSGIEWLGEVPEHWEVKRLSLIGSFFKGCGGTKEDEVEDGVPCVRYGDIYTQHQYFIRETRSNISEESTAKYTPIHYGDILFAGSGETIVGNQQKWDTFVKERSGGNGSVVGLPEQVVVAFAAG